MKVRELRLFADQNVHRQVVRFLREQNVDVVAASEEGLARAVDADILRRARELDRVLLTHDRGFGELVVRRRVEHAGVILVRPHRRHSLVLEQIREILDMEIGTPPLIATFVGDPPNVRLRLRR